jgi:hypothetical protein
VPQEFNESANVDVDRNDMGAVRGVLHSEQAYIASIAFTSNHICKETRHEYLIG